MESRYSGKIRRTVSSAALIIAEVRNVDGTVKDEIRLDATQAKRQHARTVFVNDKLRKVEIFERCSREAPRHASLRENRTLEHLLRKFVRLRRM